MFFKKGLCVFFCFLVFFGCHNFSVRNSGNKGPYTYIKDISLFPINHFRFRLSELKSSKAIVIVMRDKGCHRNEQYGPHLAELEKEYVPKGIKFIYSYVGGIDRDKSAQADLKKFQFKGNYLIDSDLRLSKMLKIKTTGDVVVLTPDLRMIYKGPVDDQFLLQKITKPRNNYLKDSLDHLLSGASMEFKEIPSTKCAVSLSKIKQKVFFEDVAPVIENKCLNCHSQNQTLIDFVDYESIYGRRAMIKYVIENNLMPPWFIDSHSGGPWKNNFDLTATEKEMLLRWLDSGLPYKKKNVQGHFFSAKNKQKNRFIENPDYIARPTKPVTVPATGFLPYMHFFIEENFDEDKYIKEYRFVTKPKVLHHISFFVFDRTKFLHLKGDYAWEKMFKCLPRQKNLWVIRGGSGSLPRL